MLLELLTSAILFLCCLLLCLRRRPEKFPPGPVSWPVLGNLLNVSILAPHKSVMNLRKKYGDIIGIDLGPKRTVFINNYELIKRAFNILPLCGRPSFPHYAVQETGNVRGILFSVGKDWLELRRFAFTCIQNGFRNGEPIESLVVNEANGLVDILKENNGRPICTKHLFDIPVINTLCRVMAQERYSLTDANFLKILQHVRNYASSVTSQGLPVFFPKWAKTFRKISGYQYHLNNLNPVLKYIQAIIDKHRKTYQDGIERDLIDCYLKKIEATTDENSPFFKDAGAENLLYTLHEMFAAGVDTTATTLRWTVFLMAHHLDIQEKLRNVISDYMKERWQPSVKEKQIVPFVEAVIMEVLRFSAIAPLGIFHEATEDVQFEGYLIPKGTTVVPNLFAALHDPEVWGDPENFRPERFLTTDETEVIRHPALIPFSSGRRVCPGKYLARDELFIFTMKLFHSFKVEFDSNEPIPAIKYVPGTIVSPVDHKIIFSEL